MSDRSSTVGDCAVALDPAIVCNHPDDVADVRTLEGFRLFVRFLDGVQGVVDMTERVTSKEAGVFGALADPVMFRQVGIEYGAVTWANGVDLAPDAMHKEFLLNGAWVLR